VEDKGKGKQQKVITFQSQPAIVTIKREVIAEKEEEARLARNTDEGMSFGCTPPMVLLVIRISILMTLVEMMFELEPEGKGRGESKATEGAIITRGTVTS
jgi:hypothetical protein